MNGWTVAIRYAKALYEVSIEQNMTEIVHEDIRVINKIMTQAVEIKSYCVRFHADRSREMVFINTAFIPYVSSITGEMLKIAVRNGRLKALPYIPEAFKKISDTASGIMEITIESDCEIEESLRKIIEEKMGKRFGKKIRLSDIVTPDLLGGFRLIWDDRMIDMSILGRLKKMRALIKTA